MNERGVITISVLGFLALGLFLALRAKTPQVSTVGDVTSNITTPPTEGLSDWIAAGLDRLGALAADFGKASGTLAFQIPGHAGRTLVDLKGLGNGEILELPGGGTAQWIAPKTP